MSTKGRNMTENELDTIINLIPQATSRQIEVISGQVDVHKFLVSEKGAIQNLISLEGERCKVCDNILQECECKKKGESYE
jgi:hypothetical protein